LILVNMKTLLSMAATVLFGVYASVAVADDPEKGGKVFKKCKACHAVGDGAKKQGWSAA
jgi:cytochrome c